VVLRALDPSDAHVVTSWYADHEFSVLDGNIYPSSRPVIEEFLKSLQSPAYPDVSLGITIDGGMLIGIARLKRVSPEDRGADFGIAITKPYWDRGYGTDATGTILRLAFTEMNLHRCELTVLESNLRARRVYEKCGFREEGRLRAARWRNGGWCDEILMGILEREFRAFDDEASAVEPPKPA
jgi:RimJ/RimL family protein N-acetyltransferase